MVLRKLRSDIADKYEFLLDKIAEALIKSRLIDTTIVENNQKFIRDSQLQIGAGSGVLALFQKDTEANSEDGGKKYTSTNGSTTNELQGIVSQITNVETIKIFIVRRNSMDNDLNISISMSSDNYIGDITDLVFTYTNPLNVSQFIPLQNRQSVVDVEQAEEFLDTNIYELLPPTDTRQARINRLFQELNVLLPPILPQFDDNDDKVVDRNQEGDWIGDGQYQQANSISYAQDNQDGNINEEDAFLHRLKDTANDTNSDSTIQDIYDRVVPYLDDLLEDVIEPQDERPNYKNQSSGYLQFRNLNQGIIIRNTNQNFIEGLNPNTQDYLQTGFTITMWVRFLDKVSSGTLFNFGSPTRNDDTAFGFKLETYVLDKDDGDFTQSGNYDTFGEAADYINPSPGSGQPRDPNYPLIYENSNTARFVRLVVNDNGTLRDSHVGTGGGTKMNTIWVDENNTQSERFRRLQTTFIPEDFQEWYFICASFNPIVDEDNSFSLTGPNSEVYDNNTNFWMNHIDPISGETITQTNYGNRCKVEIISKTNLLKSKGFKI